MNCMFCFVWFGLVWFGLGSPKILKECDLPVTGKHCVDLIITELAVFEVHPQRGLTLTEKYSGVTVEEIRSKTEAPFEVCIM
jgi:acyl CoA:acetate/3-ketoacid CoA transferase beta subunit